VGRIRVEKHATTEDNAWWRITGMADQNVIRAGITWQKTVEDEHAQSDRIREKSASEDFFRPVAHRFVPTKKGEPSQDDTVERLVELITPEQTVLDVGAGGGRLMRQHPKSIGGNALIVFGEGGHHVSALDFTRCCPWE